MLQTREDDRGCAVFLGPRGCTVHPDRPLACRIYPLARWVSPEGDESFGNLQPHPQTAGVYGTSGTVADYLAAQGLAPYFAMGDRYGELYDRMVAIMERTSTRTTTPSDATSVGWPWTSSTSARSPLRGSMSTRPSPCTAASTRSRFPPTSTC